MRPLKRLPNTSIKASVEGLTAAVISALVGSVIVMRLITDTRTALIALTYRIHHSIKFRNESSLQRAVRLQSSQSC